MTPNHFLKDTEWGLLVGLHVWNYGLLNVLKVPGVLIFASLGSLPAGIVAMKLTGMPIRARDFIRAFYQSVFSGTLVMAVLAPVIALFYRSSATMGPRLAVGSAALGFGVAVLILLRRLLLDLADSDAAQKSAKAIGERDISVEEKTEEPELEANAKAFRPKRERRQKEIISKPLIVSAVFAFTLVFGAVLVQSIAVFSPILPEHTLFDGGVDSIWGKR